MVGSLSGQSLSHEWDVYSWDKFLDLGQQNSTQGIYGWTQRTNSTLAINGGGKNGSPSFYQMDSQILQLSIRRSLGLKQMDSAIPILVKLLQVITITQQQVLDMIATLISNEKKIYLVFTHAW